MVGDRRKASLDAQTEGPMRALQHLSLIRIAPQENKL